MGLDVMLWNDVDVNFKKTTKQIFLFHSIHFFNTFVCFQNVVYSHFVQTLCFLLNICCLVVCILLLQQQLLLHKQEVCCFLFLLLCVIVYFSFLKPIQCDVVVKTMLFSSVSTPISPTLPIPTTTRFNFSDLIPIP